MLWDNNVYNICNDNLFDKGEGDQVPGDNAVVHELQEGGESEGQHLTKAEGKQEFCLPGLQTELPIEKVIVCVPHILNLRSLGSALDQARQGPDALHVDELRGKGGVCGQLGELLQSLQPSVDAVGLDPLQELASGPALPGVKMTSI